MTTPKMGNLAGYAHLFGWPALLDGMVKPWNRGRARHADDRHPTPKDPMVRYGQFRQPPDDTAEWMRDDGTDNLKSVTA